MWRRPMRPLEDDPARLVGSSSILARRPLPIPVRRMAGRTSSPLVGLPAILLAASLLAGCSGPAPLPAQPLFAADQPAPASHQASIGDPDQSLVRMADYFRERQKPQAAIAFYERAALNATKPERLVSLGKQLAELGALEQAAASYRRASMVDPDNLDAKLGLGMVLLRQGSMQAGIDYFGQLDAAADGRSLRLCNAYGAALDLNADHVRAQDVYHRCLKIDSDDRDARANLALSLALGGQSADAIALARTNAEADGAGERSQRNLILILALAGQGAEAWRIGRIKLGSQATSHLLDQAAQAGLIDDRSERAQAIGFGLVDRRH